MPSPRSIANLKPWPRGRSGNKSGNPLPTRDDTVMRTLYLIAIDRKHRDCVRAIIVWLERTRGKTPDRIDVGGKINVENEENPITTALEQAVAKLKRHEAAAADKDGR